MPAPIRKPKLVVFCGLAGQLDAYAPELKKRLPNSVLLNKNTLTDALLDGKNHTTPEYKLVKDKMYAALNQLVLDQLYDGNDVILHGYYGDKLTQKGTVELIVPYTSVYEVRVIYLHCDATTHQAILAKRDSARDADKQGDKYYPYRRQHMRNHLRELAQVSGVLFIDVQNDPFEANMAKVLNYVNGPAPFIHVTQLDAAAQDRLDKLTDVEVCDDLNRIKSVLAELRGITLDKLNENQALLTRSTWSLTPMYYALAAVGAAVSFTAVSSMISSSCARPSVKY